MYHVPPVECPGATARCNSAPNVGKSHLDLPGNQWTNFLYLPIDLLAIRAVQQPAYVDARLHQVVPFESQHAKRVNSAVTDVNEINVCGHGPHTLISLTPSLAARTEKMAASQRKFDRFRIPPVMQMERDIACIQ